MRVLLDECVPRGIRRFLSGHVVRSVQTLGWSGLADSRLVEEAEGRFDVIVTTDVRLATAPALTGRSVSVVVLRARRTSIRALAPAAAQLPRALSSIRPGMIVELQAGDRT